MSGGMDEGDNKVNCELLIREITNVSSFPEPPENRASDWLTKELRNTDPHKLALAQKACGHESTCESYKDTQTLIAETCDEIRDMLLSKNKAYGNSALDPVRVFSRCSAKEQILVRIDDKLSRIQRGSSLGEDTVKDLIGYLVLLRVAEKMETN